MGALDISPPKKIPHVMTLHGDTRTDDYFWLRDDDREDPSVLAYLQEENRYGRAMMASQNALQKKVLKEIVDRIPPHRAGRCAENSAGCA
ncbi:hypothetical protein CRX72_19870 [Pantoea sp. BRM17]|nr:hypothetical protein CRX72_19870 [Pantoea sp. BRM17]